MKLFSVKLSTAWVILVAICTLFLTTSVFGQEMAVGKSVHNDTSLPLRDIVGVSSSGTSWEDGVVPIGKITPKYETKYEEDYALQLSNGTSAAGTIIQNFDGIPIGVGGLGFVPPDPSMDVGPNHVMEMVNSAYQIFDKNGNSLLGPLNLSNLWAGFPGPWATSLNDGDPVVLYDQAADRWFFSQFSLPNGGNGPEYILIAISQTPDPTGAWHRYGFEFTEFPDYPHYGVWPDGYYMSVNRFGAGYTGTYAVAFERDQMLNGNAAQFVTFPNSPATTYSLLPSDWDGVTTPPAGAPNYFVQAHDDAFYPGTDGVDIYEFTVDWNNTANSTFTGPTFLATNAFSGVGNIPQAGTGQLLDALSDRMLQRLQYRNFGTHQSMVVCQTVDAGGDRAGKRWYEFRNTGGGWSVFQQGTYAPADGVERWMGSIAMNGNGDIALGYTASSANINPEIRFTGRRTTDPLGTMTVAETTIFASGGSQTGADRWGDYSQMAVDPVDDQTFWFVHEYIPNTSWNTRIASFNFGGGPQPDGVLVWEGQLGGQDYSGAFINTFLMGEGLTTTYTSTFPASLIGYDAVFLSFGNFGDGTTNTEFTAAMGTSVEAYLNAGGKCYLEGGDALGFDPGGTAAVINLFGLTATNDGGTNVIDGLAGQPGAITNGMLFTASTQVNNEFIDTYTPNGGILSFNESTYGDVGVQNAGAVHRTFCFSYALAELTDGAAPSTRNNLLTEIATFFDLLAAQPPPDISVNPTTFTFNVPVGGNDNGTLTISNVAPAGSQDLNFNIIDEQAVLSFSDGSEISAQLKQTEKSDKQFREAKSTNVSAGGDCPWLSTDISNGTIAPGNNQPVDVEVDATGLTAGTYNCNLTITSNDPDESTVTVPVELNVQDAGGGFLGDVNDDDQCNSTDALVILSFDVGLTIPPDFLARINAGFGDVNSDQVTNSTDALIILSFDAGINVPFPVCEPFNPPTAPTVYSEVEKSIGGKIEVTANPVIAEITRGMTVEIPVNIDVSAFDLKLGSYTATLEWDNTTLEFESVEGGTTKGFDRPTVNVKGTDKGKLVFSSAVPLGAKGMVNVLNLKLKVIGKSGERSAVKLIFTSMAAAKTFENLLPYLESKQDINSLVSVGSNPTEYGLDNYPNPFNPTTKINYSLPVAGLVKIIVYNTLGQQVRVLVNQEQEAGQYIVEWNSRNEHNQTLSSGVYILRMEAADFVKDKKLLLLK